MCSQSCCLGRRLDDDLADEIGLRLDRNGLDAGGADFQLLAVDGFCLALGLAQVAESEQTDNGGGGEKKNSDHEAPLIGLGSIIQSLCQSRNAAISTV